MAQDTTGVRVTVRLTAREAAAVEAACRQMRLTRSEYVRRALDAMARDDGVLGPRFDALDRRLQRLEDRLARGGPAPTAEPVPAATPDDTALAQDSLAALLGGWAP